MMQYLIRRFRRETADGSFVATIDGLRFIAIVSVILFHLQDYLIAKTGASATGDWLAPWLKKGNFGVPLFFAISGFVIARPFFAGTAPNLGRYFARRLTRLEPPYLINLLVVYVLLVLVLDRSAVALLPNLLASALYQHNLVYDEMSRINFVAWSLEVEFQFYLVAPLLLWVALRASRAIRRSALVLLVSVGALAYEAPEVLHWGTLLRYFGFFFAGILCADVYVNDWRERPRAAYAWDLVAIAGWTLTALALFQPHFPRPSLTVGVLLAVLGSLAGRVSRVILGFPPIYLVGGMCYTLYLYHFLIISAVGRVVVPALDPDWPLWQQVCIAGLFVVPAVIVGGAVLFLLTEKPFMHWRRRTSSVPGLQGA